MRVFGASFLLLIIFSSCRKSGCGCRESTYVNNVLIKAEGKDYGSDLTPCQRSNLGQDTTKINDSTFTVESSCAIPG